MKISKKAIESVVTQVAGEDVLPLVKVLQNRKNVSEFKLAENIRKEINPTRNMLYRLYDASLVSFVRKKDKKKGWYVYYWTFNANRIKFLMKEIRKRKVETLKERLIREKSGQFYICKNRCFRVDFDQGSEFTFKCPECGLLLDLEDNTKKIKQIEKDIKELEKELKK